MTLIVKELIIKGNVVGDNASTGEFTVSKDELEGYLEHLKKEIEKECTEKVMQKVEAKTER